MKIVTAAEMREIDLVTSARFGVPSLTLMENAGTTVADFVASQYPSAKRVGVICGKGNNGGDGFVVARKLHQSGKEVRVLFLAEPAELRGDAAEMFTRLPVPPVTTVSHEQLKTEPARAVFDADVLGEQVGAVARADAVVTFTAPRPAHIFGMLTAGPTIVTPIGSPDDAVVSSLQLNVITGHDVAPLIGPRSPIANKGSFGHVLVLGGSTGKAGAAAMAGMAALRAGAGLSTVATAKSVMATVAGFHPELMTEPLDETDAGSLSIRALQQGRVDSLAERKTVLAVGPGISRHPETAEFVRGVVKKYKLPIVLDADGLKAFEGRSEELKGKAGTLVITPHPG